MARASRTMTIRRPVAEVYAFFADPVNDPTWRRNVPTDLEVIVQETNQRYEFRHSVGPVRPDCRMTFREVDGHTTMTFTLNIELPGLQKYTLGRQVQKAMDAQVADLDQARMHLERDEEGGL